METCKSYLHYAQRQRDDCVHRIEQLRKDLASAEAALLEYETSVKEKQRNLSHAVAAYMTAGTAWMKIEAVEPEAPVAPKPKA